MLIAVLYWKTFLLPRGKMKIFRVFYLGKGFFSFDAFSS